MLLFLKLRRPGFIKESFELENEGSRGIFGAQLVVETYSLNVDSLKPHGYLMREQPRNLQYNKNIRSQTQRKRVFSHRVRACFDRKS